jgi:pyrimidine-nucleoside phosphorylase
VNFVELIARKRDGLALEPGEIAAFVEAAVNGDAGDEQLAALLMAICLRGASPRETQLLTEAMRDSGERWRLAEVVPAVVDKHSTGGVGDTVSIIFAPLMASCGVPVAMMAGAGLGHTQGTLDKLDAIPGFTPVRERADALARLEECGACLAAQGEHIAPADRKLYALRDITATVPSLPLIVSSIMSKKLAVGAGRLILDVKAGSGAFCKTGAEARALAVELVRVAESAGVAVRALITDMAEPLGAHLGCANEVRAALDVLDGGGSGRLRELTIALAAEALSLAGRSVAQAREELTAAIASGQARARFDAIVRAHGGDPDPDLLPRARKTMTVTGGRAGFVQRIDGEALGWVAVGLGAGRRRSGDQVDHGAGITVHVQVGDRVEVGSPLATLELGTATPDERMVADRTVAAFGIADRPPTDRPLILSRLGGSG